MSVLLVGYDLRNPGRNYDDLYRAIMRYSHCHALESMWFIDTQESPVQVRDKLCDVVDADDQIYVMRLRKNWAACRTEDCSKWLKSEARSWD